MIVAHGLDGERCAGVGHVRTVVAICMVESLSVGLRVHATSMGTIQNILSKLLSIASESVKLRV
jgi:hypothetical protein